MSVPTVSTVLLVAAGGGAGAVLRHLVARWSAAAGVGAFPLGTVAVNVVGSLILGAVVGSASPPGWVLALVGTGLCGGLTTFSTFALETVRLGGAGDRRTAVAYVSVSVLGALAAAATGFALTSG